MTVEERAQQVVEKFCEDEKELRGPDGKQPVSFVAYSSRLRQRVKEALRDQIEDCAKVGDVEENELMAKAEEIKQQPGLKSVNQAAATQLIFAAMLIQQTGVKIRALAAPSEDKQTGS